MLFSAYRLALFVTTFLFGFALFAFPYHLVLALERFKSKERPVFTPSICGWIAAGFLSLILAILKGFQDKNPMTNDFFYKAIALKLQFESALLSFGDAIPTMSHELAKRLRLRPGIIRIPKYQNQFSVQSNNSPVLPQLAQDSCHLAEGRLLVFDPKHNSEECLPNSGRRQKILRPQCGFSTFQSNVNEKTKVLKSRHGLSVPTSISLCDESASRLARMTKKPREHFETSRTTRFGDEPTYSEGLLRKEKRIQRTSTATSRSVQRYPEASKALAMVNLQSMEELGTFTTRIDPLGASSGPASPSSVQAEAGSMLRLLSDEGSD